jgi:hypothetical protein
LGSISIPLTLQPVKRKNAAEEIPEPEPMSTRNLSGFGAIFGCSFKNLRIERIGVWENSLSF